MQCFSVNIRRLFSAIMHRDIFVIAFERFAAESAQVIAIIVVKGLTTPHATVAANDCR